MATSGGRLNPYKLGVELYRSIEERWNKGQFGKEWEECDDLDAQDATGTCASASGREKIFEVRALYNDVTFIDEFLTAGLRDRAQALHASTGRAATTASRSTSREFEQ